VSLSPQQESQIRAAALASERRNRPVGLIAIASAILLASTIFAGWSVASAQRARSEALAARQRLIEVDAIAEEIQDIRTDPQRSGGDTRYAPETRLRSKLNQVADRLGMEQTPSIRDAGAKQLGVGSGSPLEKRSIEVRMDDLPLDAAMEWINEAVREIPGLHVTGVELRPGRPEGWNIRVQLSRWEFRQ